MVIRGILGFERSNGMSIILIVVVILAVAAALIMLFKKRSDQENDKLESKQNRPLIRNFLRFSFTR